MSFLFLRYCVVVALSSAAVAMVLVTLLGMQSFGFGASGESFVTENKVWRVCKDRTLYGEVFMKVVLPTHETRTVDSVLFRKVTLRKPKTKEGSADYWIAENALCVSAVLDEKALFVDTGTNELYFVQGDSVLGRFPVGTGRVEDGFESPHGIFQIGQKERCPVYYGDTPENPVAGCLPGNPLGRAALWFQGRTYGVHGTSQPDLIAAKGTSSEDRRVSKGCLRLNDSHISWLFDRIPNGTQIWIMKGLRHQMRGGAVHLTGIAGRKSVALIKLEPGTTEVILEQKSTGALFRFGGGDVSKFRFFAKRLPVGSFQGVSGFRVHYVTESVQLSSR